MLLEYSTDPSFFFKFRVLSQEPLHQFKACLYSFKRIFHAESKYGNENLNLKKKMKMWENLDLSSALDMRIERVKGSFYNTVL